MSAPLRCARCFERFEDDPCLPSEGDATVMALARGELRSTWWDVEESALVAHGFSAVTPERSHACEEDDGPVKGLAFAVPVTIADRDVQLLVDTGAQHSDVFATSTAGKKLAGHGTTTGEPMYTASGKISARRLENVALTPGAFKTTSGVDLIQGDADRTCPRDGVIATDVLRSCTPLFGRSRMTARCVRPAK